MRSPYRASPLHVLAVLAGIGAFSAPAIAQRYPPEPMEEQPQSTAQLSEQEARTQQEARTRTAPEQEGRRRHPGRLEKLRGGEMSAPVVEGDTIVETSRGIPAPRDYRK